MGEETARTVQEKYGELLQLIGLMTFHPFQNNYYNAYASFGDSVPSDIEKDAEIAFKSSDRYKSLLKIKEERENERAGSNSW